MYILSHYLENATSEEFEQIEVDLLSVVVLLLMNTHEQVLHVHHDAQEPV